MVNCSIIQFGVSINFLLFSVWKLTQIIACITFHVYKQHLVICSLYIYYFMFQLLDVVYREETLINVMRSVTRNGRSIILTAVLAFILIYMFSIVGYIFFQSDFLMEFDRVPQISEVKSKYSTTSLVQSPLIMISLLFVQIFQHRFFKW